jgi:hypothetical protein
VKKKQDDWEVNTTDRRDRKDRKYHGNRKQPSSDQKEKSPFRRPDDTEKWCEIHHTSGHDSEECKTFLDRKKMPPPRVPVALDMIQKSHDDQMGEINVIFGGSMSIASKT